MIKAVRDAAAANPWLIAVVVSLATFMEVLDTTIVNVSLTHIAGSLGATPDEATWVLTSYLVANGIVLPISGWLAQVLGRKRFFMMCIFGFTLASLACGVAESLEMLVLCRLIQGLCGGGLQPIQQSIVMDAFPPHKRGQVFALTGITLIAAPVLGPTLGGWITDTFSWHWVFLINVPVGLLAFFLVGQLVKDPPHAEAQGLKRVDYTGLGLIAVGLGALQVVLDKGQTEDWFHSDMIIILSILSAVCLISAVLWLLKQDDPVVDLRLVQNRSFGLGMVLIFLTGFALYGSSALLPLLVQSQFGYDALLSGLVLSPGALLLMFLMPLSGQLVSRIQARFLVAFGLICCAVGMFYTSFISPQTDYETFVLMRMIQVMGIPFLFIPISAMAFADVPKEKSSKASAFFSLSRNLGGSVGIAIVSSYVARHNQIHQNTLVERLVPGDPVYENAHATMTQAIQGQGIAPGMAEQMATGQIYREVLHQAAILSFHDVFMFMCIMMMCGAALTLFLPANDPRAGHSKDAPAAH